MVEEANFAALSTVHLPPNTQEHHTELILGTCSCFQLSGGN